MDKLSFSSAIGANTNALGVVVVWVLFCTGLAEDWVMKDCLLPKGKHKHMVVSFNSDE
jgi:hypothetical protein